jgi:hypothetical protein
MKLAAVTFFLLLLYAHAGTDPALEWPLSVFRDGERAWLGHVLFALLLLIGGLHTAAQVRARRPGDAAASGLAVFLLLLVAVTPSWGAFHLAWSFLLLGLLFGYYAIVLYRVESFWLMAHLAVPVALAIVTRFHSYGIWQKSFIVYFMIAAVVHHHILMRVAPADRPRPDARAPGSRKRRKVYRLEPGPEWSRREPQARRA